MRKYIFPFFFLILFVLAGCSKSDNPSSPSGNDPQNSANISSSDFIQTPTGGDPRATYAPNSPVFDIFLNSIPNATVIKQLSTDTGGGTINFTGSTSSSGTYSTTNLSINVSGKISIYKGSDSVIVPILIPGTIGKGSGTWSVISQGVMVMDNTDTLQYAVNDKGMFIQFPVEDNGTVYGTAVLALKK